MKTQNLPHGDFFGFISVYGLCRTLFVRLKNVFELSAVGYRERIAEELYGRCRTYEQETDRDPPQ
jgi:hypothetical protein